MKNNELRSMISKWPSSIVARNEVKSFTGGAFSGKSLANFDSQGTGPEGRFKLGRQTVYPVKSLVLWLEERCSQ